ncbi:PadR family transcriptional regulator [Stenotrophomonas acidaminiphila]|uniref:PadR family transcriptional regulator n=1 Tax=Stenotrophomonas acidaminiphila TaxID=128780 RepID=UPI001FAFD501|nr:PadR family transcriptional regulator [Stenotrophomonas acidaminiphila]
MPAASSNPRQHPAARALGRGDLRLLLLALLGQAPRHGYELIQQVGEMFMHVYVPSAGSVYPLLADFEKQCWVVAEADGGRRRYRITATGLAQLALHAAEVEAAQRRARERARAMAKASLPPPVRAAMQRLKKALVARNGRWQDADAAHVAALLDQAAAHAHGNAAKTRL